MSFDKIREQLGFETLMIVPDGIGEIITALDAERVRGSLRPPLPEHSLSAGRSRCSTETFPELPLFDLQLQPQDLEAVAETLRSGWLTLGPRTAAFEEAFAAHLGARHAIAVSSCTAALHLAYLAAGVDPAMR